MNPIITREVLEQAGVKLDGQDVDALLTRLNQTLEERVGTEITMSLSDEKLEEMVDLQESGTEDQLVEWMNTNVPELEQITQDEVDIILGELAENSDDISKVL